MRARGTEPARRRPTRAVAPPPLVGLLAGLLVAAGIAGCASSGQAPPAPGQPGGPSEAADASFAPLEALAERQRARHGRKIRPPASIRVRIEPVAPDDQAARQPLDAVLSALLDDPLELVAPTPGGEISQADQGAAAQAFTVGRYARRAGDLDRANDALERAAALDPAAAGVWTELGEAQLAAGARRAAMRSLESAVALGAEGTRPYVLLGLEARRTGRVDRAAAFLARARARVPEATNDGLNHVVDATLGESLVASGRLRAGVELLEAALDLPRGFSTGSEYRAALIDVYRRQSGLWELVGDTWVRLGEPERALGAYQRASVHAGIDAARADARAIAVALEMGRPADAALTLLRRIRDARGLVAPTDVELLAHIAERADLADQIDAALVEIAGSLDRPSPSVSIALAGARAAVLPPRDARRTLRAVAEAHPTNVRPLSDLFRSYEASALALRSAVDQVGTHPFTAPVVAAALLTTDTPGADLLAGLRRASDARAAAVLEAHLRILLGNPYRFAKRLDFGGGDDLALAAAAAGAQVAARTGRWDEAERLLERVVGAGPGPTRARAAALTAMQRYDEALAAFAPLIEGDAPVVSDLMAAAQLAIFAGEPGRAASLLEEASVADPDSTDVYGARLRLHSASGPLPDQERLTDVARTLRDRLPMSQLVQILAAQEFVQRGLREEAERRLSALTTQRPMPSALPPLLIDVWLKAHEAGDADALRRGLEVTGGWLGELPADPVVATAHAELIAADDRVDEARAVLEQAYARTQAEPLRKRIERLLGERGDQPGAAALARARLDRATLSIDDALELASLLNGTSASDRIAETIVRGVPTSATLTGDQARELLLVVFREAEAGEGRWVDPTVPLLFDLAAERVPRIPLNLHQARLEALAGVRDGAFDPERVMRAVADARAQHPNLEADVVLLPVQILFGDQRVDLGFELLSRAALADAGADNRMARQWASLVMTYGQAQHARDLAERLEEGGRIGDIIALATGGNRSVLPQPLDTPARRKSELAYLIASGAMGRDREQAAIDMYRVALAYDPEHVWAANDLGYHLADVGKSLEEAERMLEFAHGVGPNVASITDSIGWLRYRQSRFDEAAALLERATTLPLGSTNPTIFDHLGDARWRLGQRAAATDAWNRAHELLADQLRAQRLSGDNNSNTELIQQYRLRTRKIRSKITAAEANRQPDVAPIGPADRSDWDEPEANGGQTISPK